MSHEIDGNGNVKVWKFTVKCFYADGSLDCETVHYDTDYTDAWNWARSLIAEIEGNDPDYGTPDAYKTDVEIDYEWQPEGEELVEF